MSEYQYYEWQTIDRLLTPEQQAAVNRLSSHIEVSSSRAMVTYNWGDFKHDPKKVLLQYFDAFFYLANWGSRHLMFSFPKGLLNQKEIEPYCDEEQITFQTFGEYQVLAIVINPDDGGHWVEEQDGTLSLFTQLREDLLQGDYRLLYLAWLNSRTLYEDDDEDDDEYSDEYDEDEEDEVDDEDPLEPPVPPGLKYLSPALQNFVQVFELNPYVVMAAAEASPDLRDPLAINYRELIARLAREEVDGFLVRLAEGEPGMRLALRKRLSEFMPKEAHHTPPARSLKQLLERAEQIKEAEKQRKIEEARLKHIAEMKALAPKEEKTWRQVEDLLENGRKIASVYDEATNLLEKLKQLADFQNTRGVFANRVRQLANKFGSRSSLIRRWHEHGWL